MKTVTTCAVALLIAAAGVSPLPAFAVSHTGTAKNTLTKNDGTTQTDSSKEKKGVAHAKGKKTTEAAKHTRTTQAKKDDAQVGKDAGQAQPEPRK